MMKCKKLLALMLAIFFVAGILTACGARAPMGNMAADAPAADAPAAEAAPMESPMVDSDMLTDSSKGSTAELPSDRKLIITVNMDAETEDLDAMLSHIDGKIAALGGYMESQEIYNGSAYSNYRHRNAHMTIRIPAENLSQFVDLVSQNCNIISNYRTSDDVTLQYVSLESRIKALEIEQERLLALLEQADNMEDLLTIESRLTDVRYDLEQIHSQMLVMENRINYSTIHLNVWEVDEPTVIAERTVWQKIGDGFSENAGDMWDGLVNFFIWLITAIPYLIPLGLIAAAVVLAIKLLRKLKIRRKAKKENTEEKENG